MSIYVRSEVCKIKIMNERQTHIFDWLQQVGPALAKLYEGAVKMIEDAGFSGRGLFICHAVREIRNRLTDEVAGKLDVERLEYKDEVEGLAKAWENVGLESAYEKGGCDQTSPGVPREVLVLVDRLVRKHREVAYTNREKARMLLVELEPENKTLQGSLYPVVDAWFRETEWFVDRAHVGKDIDQDDLVVHFQRFENALYSLIGYFYEGMEDIEQITKNANALKQTPTQNEVNEVVLRLGRAKYRMHFFDKLESPHWVKPLKDKGFFKSPEDPKTGEAYERWPQGGYLKKMASKVPDEVLEVINAIKSKNPFVQNRCLECLLEMPIEVAANGISIVESMFPREDKVGDLGWDWAGKHAAKLMVKLVERNSDASFKIAWVLLDAWVPLEKERRYGEDIVAKFSEHDYKKLVLEHYSKVWEVEPERAVWVLVKILNRCIETLNKEEKREGEYDASIYFGYGLELGDLDAIDIKHPRIRTILVKGICEAGKTLIRKEPTKISEFMNGLEKDSRAIFLRIIMYLLRFVPPGVERDRITKFIGDEKYFVYGQPYWYEHRRLLNDKFNDVSGEGKQAFVEWINKPKLDDELRKEIVERCKKNGKDIPNFEKEESREKAGELYLVRERFKDLYEQYKKGAGVKEDGALAPRREVSEAHSVSPEEGSPYSSEKMAKDSVGIVLNYLLEPNNYEGKEKVGGWWTAKDALAASFKADVKKRPMEYLNVDLKKLEHLDPEFLEKIFYSVSESVREGSFKKEGWERLIDLACGIVETKNKEKDWKDCFSAILWVLRDGFGQEGNRITFNETIIRKFWFVLKDLVGYNYDEKLESEEDPVQRRLRSVQGSAFEQLIYLGRVCKNNFALFFENFLKKEMRQVYTLVSKEVKRSEVNCTFGLEFAGVYWLDKEWVESNIETIFDEKMWDAVWGTYVSWGRPSPQCFKILLEKGKYAQGVGEIAKKNKYEFREKPDEGLIEHLMIGFFNGWIDFEDDLLKRFFEKASGELRGKAARFLTTGFKSVNEEGGIEKEKFASRIREYWKGRLAAIADKPEKNEKEAKELTGWVQDSVLAAKETLELLEQTLDLSGGKIGEMRDAKAFIEGVCKLGKGNELLALQCLKRAAADENMHTPWGGIHDPLLKFLEELPGDARGLGREVADLYGRYNPDKFRGVWEKLAG